jgi:hypothetical protein
MNEIKRKRALATAATDTFMTITHGAILDLNRNPLVVIPSSNAFGIKHYTDDMTFPELVAFDIDMNHLTTATVTMSFTETVLASSVVPNEITFQRVGDITAPSSLIHEHYLTYTLKSSGSSATVETDVHTLPASTRARNDSDTVVLYISWADLNALKLLFFEGTTDDTVFISFPTTALIDMAGNPVAIVPTTTAFLTNKYVPDAVGPTLLGYDFDMSVGVRGELFLTFDEIVEATSINISDLVFQGGAAFGLEAELDGEPEPEPMGAFTTVAYRLVGGSVPMYAGSETACADLCDSAQQGIQYNASVHECAGYTWDETKDIACIVQSKSYATVQDSSVVKVTVGVADMNELKVRSGPGCANPNECDMLLQENARLVTGVASSEFTTYLRFDSALIEDKNGLSNFAIGADAAQNVESFTADDVNPKLLLFTLDMDTGILLLVFDEVMDASLFQLNLACLVNEDYSEEHCFRTTDNPASTAWCGAEACVVPGTKVD